MAKEVFCYGKLPEFLNKGLIKLIPKTAAKDSIRGWFPIALLSVSYKILEKAVSLDMNRLVQRKFIFGYSDFRMGGYGMG
jgi:hypothetical protein